VVDDFLPWHSFVKDILEAETDLKILSFTSDGLQAIQMAEELQPDVILMDVNLPTMNGLKATQQSRIVSPGSKILFLSADDAVDHIRAAFDAGASGYVLKSDSYTDLVPAIRVVLLGQKFVSRSLRDLRED